MKEAELAAQAAKMKAVINGIFDAIDQADDKQDFNVQFVMRTLIGALITTCKSEGVALYTVLRDFGLAWESDWESEPEEIKH